MHRKQSIDLQISVQQHRFEPRYEKTGFYIYAKTKALISDQLRGYREADQRLCFRNTDGTIPLLPKSEILSLVVTQSSLCWTRSETPKTSFLTTRLTLFTGF